jgi:hypothetical protein
MECIGSAVLPRVESTSDAADAGTAKHRYVELLVAGKTQEEALSAIDEQFHDSCLAIDTSFTPMLAGCFSEVAYAYHCETFSARKLGEGIGRAYGELTPQEIAATMDYCARLDLDSTDILFPEAMVGHVYDLKTGRIDPGSAADNWQLAVGAAIMRALGCVSVEVSLIWAPEHRKAVIRTAKLDAMELDAIGDQLRSLSRRIEHAGSALAAGAMPSLRTGPHCQYCPAKTSCPAQTGIIRAAMVDGPLTLQDLSARMMTLTSDQLSEAWTKAQPLLEAAKAVKTAFAAAAMVQPFRTSETTEYGLRKTMRTDLDGGLVYDVATEMFGVEAAKDFVSLEGTKASVARGLKAADQAGALGERFKTRKAAETVFYDELTRRGGVTKVEASRLDEHAIKEPK